MGGAVSSGRDNNELIDNLMSGNYIRSKDVERVFRALDRADYMTLESKGQAYKDLAWRNGPLHLSSPCIYSEVMEGLELKPGLSFLNIGSGTGYLSTLVGLILGSAGVSHGVEVHPAVVEYAVKKMSQFFENSSILDDFDFCEPKFYQGNGLCIQPLESGYDRVYCGGGCPEQYENYFKRFIKVGGILVMPFSDSLLQIRRVANDKWTTRSILNVSFATLRIPTAEEAANTLKLERLAPVRLQYLARGVVRSAMRGGVVRRHPELRETPRAPPPAACPRRICIPIEHGGAVEGLNVLHDLDTDNGANEMNALLSLVISMGQNRVAGALQVDRITPSGSSEEEDETEDLTDNEEEPDNQDDHNPEQNLPSNRESSNNRNGDGTNDDQSRSGPRNGRRPKNDDDDDKPDDVEAVGPNSVGDDSHFESQVDVDSPRTNDVNTSRSSRLYDRRPSNNPCHNRLSNILKWQRQRLFNNSRELFALYEGDARPSTSNGKTKQVTGDAANASGDNTANACENDSGSNKDSNGVPDRPDLPGIPSEVEIEFCKMVRTAVASTSTDLEWEDTQKREWTPSVESSEDETDTTKSNPKRQKLDSGIGENTPTVSSPEKTKSDSSDSSHIQSDCPTDTSEGSSAMGSRARSPSYWLPSAEELEHQANLRRRIAQGGDARRARLSYLMKQAVRELPLPHALKRFVNLGRCFEF